MNVAGIEIIITVVIALALSCVGFVVHGKLLQREVRRALEARRLRRRPSFPWLPPPGPLPPTGGKRRRSRGFAEASRTMTRSPR